MTHCNVVNASADFFYFASCGGCGGGAAGVRFWLANVGLNHSHVTRRESIFEFMETKKVEM